MTGEAQGDVDRALRIVHDEQGAYFEINLT
jgi:hypothetical protein